MNKIIANIGWIFFDKIFRLLVGMFVSVWIARYLGPSEFGVLNYAILFPTVFTALASFGINNILLIDLVSSKEDPEKQRQIIQTGLFIKIFFGVISFFGSCVLNYILNVNNTILFYLINITGITLILQSSDVFDIYFQSHTKAKLSIVIKLSAFVFASILRAYALITNQNIIYLVYINIFELFMVYVIMIIVYQKNVGNLVDNIICIINYSSIQKILHVAWPIMMTEFFVFVYMKVDQFMIESISTKHELGLYGAALRLSETWYFVASAVVTSFYPKIADSWLIDKEKFYKQYQMLLNTLTYISIGLAILISIFANQLIEILYGANFQNAGIVLSVHIWAGVFVFTGVGTNNIMIMNGLQKFVLLKTIIGAVINILLNLWLIPEYGALGASISTLFSYSLQAYGLNIFSKKARFVFSLQSKSFVNFLMLKKPLTANFN